MAPTRTRSGRKRTLVNGENGEKNTVSKKSLRKGKVAKNNYDIDRKDNNTVNGKVKCELINKKCSVHRI